MKNINNKEKMHPKEPKEFEEKVIQVDRVSRTVKGGKRLRFRVLVVVGNRRGKVGMGIGKAQEVPLAVQKAVHQAKKHLITIPLIKNTIPHEVKKKFGGAFLFLKPARPGTPIIVGGAVRAVVELAGIKHILGKILGSANKINNVKATILALEDLKPRLENKKPLKVDKKEEELEKKDKKPK